MRVIGLIVLVALLNGCAALVVGGVAAGAGAAHDRRSFGTVVDDANIELTAYDAINKDKELALKNNVNVVVFNGTLLLIGEVHTPELRERAEAKVRDIAGVHRLVNEIEITEPSGLFSSGHDKWISGRVKLALLDIVDLPEFDASRVNVTTHHAVVHLMGLVTHAEAERVVEIARNVPGVTRVVNVFEYTDEAAEGAPR